MEKRHRSSLEPIGLALLAVMPLAYLGMLIWASPGRDLDLALLVGSAAFVGVGLSLLAVGLWQRRSGRAQVGLVVLATALVGPSLLACGGAFWCGLESRRLTVRVRDAQTGRPLANASVRLSRSQANPEGGTGGKTDANGLVTLSHEFFASGTKTVVCDTGGLPLLEPLTVEAEGYWGVREPLGQYIGSGWPLHGPPPPVVEIRLHKK